MPPGGTEFSRLMLITDWYPSLLRWQLRLEKALDRLLGWRKPLEMTSFTGFYKKIWQQAAGEIAASFEQIDDGVWEVRRNGLVTIINNFKVQLDDPVILQLAGDKALCYRLFAREGLPVPDHEVYRLRELYKVERFMQTHADQLLVVKPAKGTSGARGITTHLRNLRECRRASALASLYSDKIIVERWIPGESYRLLVLDGRMIHATRRRGLRVVGDGKLTLGQLLAQADGFALSNDDRDVSATLRAQGLATESVANAGREVLVRSAPLARQKTTEERTVFNENVTGRVCGEIEGLAARAAGILGSRFAGVDLITLDPSLPLDKTGGVINEINTTPGLHHHYGLINDDASPAVKVLKHLLQVPGDGGQP